jgi:hypothetical protein
VNHYLIWVKNDQPLRHQYRLIFLLLVVVVAVLVKAMLITVAAVALAVLGQVFLQQAVAVAQNHQFLLFRIFRQVFYL